MYQALRTFINSKTGLKIPDEEFKFVEAAFTPRTIKKKQFLSHEGSVCQHMVFIVKGAMRQYTIDDRGVEHIVRFGLENWWMSDRESFSMLTASIYNIDALEDCEVLATTKEKITYLKEQSLHFLKMAHVLDENHYIANQNRIQANISFTAEEKFQQLMKTYPEFIRRFPQNMLASYLGLSPETLSRIRKQMLSK
ncbi:CRP-like cAMP-binding protein [Pedobacter sp. AK017]|uniref:Crp/Fnr family transcriptional regulator n=1 Tax=Pedobacter sp. AK017 TaxID=2723073 RepID=UPI0016071717|nr:Crp/Fnr family transcriptional regulator [Pedobacter sp. AK017]MBB5436777.1 CRP-like cAMP-binding protein [Pedobacter sp. AK017]